LFDAAPEGHADQVAFQVVIPLVIGADEFTAVAGSFTAELHAAMGAYVFHNAHLAALVAQQNHRALADGGALEVAGVGNFGFQADITPVRPVEEAFQLALVQRGVGVDAEGNTVGTVALPGRVDVHGLSPIFYRFIIGQAMK
jgi:hypothetical protein